MSKKLAIALGLLGVVGITAVGVSVCSKHNKKKEENDTDETTDTVEEQDDFVFEEEVVVEDVVETTETEESDVPCEHCKHLENCFRDTVIPTIFDIIESALNLSNEDDTDCVDDRFQKLNNDFVEGIIGPDIYATSLTHLYEAIKLMPHVEEDFDSEEVSEETEEETISEEVKENDNSGEQKQSE